MIKKLLKIYKTHFLIAATTAVVMLAQGVLRGFWNVSEIFLGAFLGSFILDTEYLINAYILEPTGDFAKQLGGYIKHRDYTSALDYFDSHRDTIKDKTLNSAFFQLILVPVSVFVAFTPDHYFVKGLVFSVYTILLYKLAEHYYANNLDEWFWVMKSKYGKKEAAYFGAVLFIILVVCLYYFR